MVIISQTLYFIMISQKTLPTFIHDVIQAAITVSMTVGTMAMSKAKTVSAQLAIKSLY